MRAVVVEGYMDVIAAHEHGFTNVVASMGTAVAGLQLDALARHAASGKAGATGVVILCLDSDEAGEAATMRALEGVTVELSSGHSRGIEVKVARPDGGKDPDEAIRSDPDSWRGSLNEAVALLDYMIDAKSKLYNLDSGQGIAGFANDIAPMIYNVPNDYDRDRYWLSTARIAGVSEQRLKTIVDRPRGTSRRLGNRPRGAGSISPQQASAALESSTGSPLEEHLLSLILQMDDLREHAIAMPAEFFHESDNRALFTAWQSSSNLGELSDELGEDLTKKMRRFAEHELPPSDQARLIEDVTQCVMRLRERHFRRIKKLESEQLKQLEGEEAQELLDRSLHSNENLRKVMTGRA